MKYAFIREHRTQFKLKTLCHLLAVSRSGYYILNWVFAQNGCFKWSASNAASKKS